MIFHRLGLINKNQRGFTMIELLVAIAITSFITGGITLAIFQVFNINTQSNEHMTALRQVQNAGYWISHDAQMTQSIVLGDDEATTDETEVLTLAWVGWEYECGGKDTCTSIYEVRYTYDDDNKLWRHQRITTNKYDKNGQLVETIYTPSEEGWDTTLIASYITPIPTVSINGNQLDVTITASVGEAVEQRTYKITPRTSA